MRNITIAGAAFCAIISASPAFATSTEEIEALGSEIQAMRQAYESRISELEAKLSKVAEAKAQKPVEAKTPLVESSSGRKVYDNSFNPSIGVILNGKFANYSKSTSEMKGYGVAHEGERPREGLSLGESELNFSANADDKFYGSMTAAIVREGGEDKVELEEAYVQTLAGAGLPTGLTAKAGRAFWNFGYLNEHHSHTDDFADRPLPYRAYLNKAFNDDGLELSYVLPTDFYTELGGGAFRGEDFPGGTPKGEGAGSYSAFSRIGGDIGDNQSWRLGGSWLGSNPKGRNSNDDAVTFIGDSNLYAADLRYTFAPTGNARQQEIILQSEYLWRDEKGTYQGVRYNDNTAGWYAQGIYKFHQQWRIGARYSRLESSLVPAGLAGGELDSAGHDPEGYSLMTDWTNSEFSRLRLQYNHEQLERGKEDNQIMLQYILSIGAHGAHKY